MVYLSATMNYPLKPTNRTDRNIILCFHRPFSVGLDGEVSKGIMGWISARMVAIPALPIVPEQLQ